MKMADEKKFDTDKIADEVKDAATGAVDSVKETGQDIRDDFIEEVEEFKEKGTKGWLMDNKWVFIVGAGAIVLVLAMLFGSEPNPDVQPDKAEISDVLSYE